MQNRQTSNEARGETVGGWAVGGRKCTLVGVTTQQGTTENALISEACSPEAAAVYEENVTKTERVFGVI